MRKQFVSTISSLFPRESDLCLFLGDIGVFGFREILKDFPRRAFNFGILEQAMVSAAAGMASEGYVPILHTIAPFMVERAYEQIKIDFGYQKLRGNFISVGASFDYAGLGCTHHCPGDIGLLYNIPGMRLFIPVSAREFDLMFRESYRNGINYFRLSEFTHSYQDIGTGLSLIRENKGSKKAVLFVGPMLRLASSEILDLPVSIYYLNCLIPNEPVKLADFVQKCYIIQDFYSGPIEEQVRLWNQSVSVKSKSPPRQFVETYGNREDAMANAGLSQKEILEFIRDD